MMCSKCKHNPMGVCELINKEIGITYAVHRKNTSPNWCPLRRKNV